MYSVYTVFKRVSNTSLTKAMKYYHMEWEEEYKATMCPICDERPKEEGENECKFCWRIGKKAGGFTNMPSNQEKLVGMQLLRENDITIS